MTARDHDLLRSPLSKSLYAGHYKDVLRATIDSADGRHAPGDTPAVVAALVFSGRQDEAAAVHRWWTREHGDDAVVAVADLFFLSVGECRTGRYQEAIARCREAVRAADPRDPLQGFFAHQAIGLLRHFTGRIPSAVQHATRARQLAAEARFSYGRMLALDLLGYSLTAKGDVHAGIALLEQSAELAEALGLVENAGAPKTAATVLRARYGLAAGDPRKELSDCVAALAPEDSYSRRMVLSEVAAQHAFGGEATKAAEAIEAASRIALPDGDRRAKTRRLIAEAVVAGLGQGPDAADAKLRAARALLDPTLDDALEVEIWWARAITHGLDAMDADPVVRARVALLAARTGMGRARFLAASADARASLELLADDKLASLLAALQRDKEEARHRITSEHSWGFLRFVYGHPPGRRVYLLHDLALLVVEEAGNVAPLDMPGSVLVALLCAIAAGPVTKEELVQRVWKMKVYRPERHDALVHTATSRLRNAMGRAGAWITSTDHGYALAEGVVIHDDRGADVRDETIADGSARPPPPSDGDAEPARSRSRHKAVDERRAVVLGALEREESMSTLDVARALHASEMTAFRVLSALVAEGVVLRTGQGKRTRYRRPP